MFGGEQLLVMLFAVVLSTPFQAGEEIGWRAYALPRMSAHMGLGWASLVLGVVWACWHLPLFLIPGTPNAGESFPVYLLTVTPLSIAIAYLYWRTGAALLPVMVMHAAINNTKDIVPSVLSAGAAPFFLGGSRIAWLSAAVLWIGAVYFMVRMRGVSTVAPGIHARSVH
jgi:membrane protease YdiL (CAAX protease family)